MLDDIDSLMIFATSPGSDTTFNSCGIPNGHALTIIATFELRELNKATHKMVLVRNPWGKSYYRGDWDKDDERWKTFTLNQVPYGIDPRNSLEDGYFVVPVERIVMEGCFEGLFFDEVDEGYATRAWYDVDNTEETAHNFIIEAPGVSGDIYIINDTYIHNTVPSNVDCFPAFYNFGDYF